MQQTMIQTIEPARIATDLRLQRRKLAHRLSAEIPIADAMTISQLSGAYCRVVDLLLRICKVPHAPKAAQEDSRRPTLDITAPQDAVESPVSTPPSSESPQ
jgi:hypothetical protein